MAFRVGGRKDSGESGKKWAAAFIGFIMLASVAGFVVTMIPSDSQNNFRYGGITFKQSPDGFYNAKMGGTNVGFFYRPEDVSGIEIPGSVAEQLAGTKAAYVSYDWNSTLSQELALLQFDLLGLLDAKGVFAQPAFTTPNQMNLTVKTCDDATMFVPIIILQESANESIRLDSKNPDCMILEAAAGNSLLRLGDRLKYSIISGGKE